TQKPSFDPTGGANVSFGNYQAVRGSAYVSGPLAGDFLAGKIAGVYNENEGTVTNAFDDSRMHDAHDWSLRGQLRFRNDSSDFVLTGSHQKVDHRPGGYAVLTPNPLLDGIFTPFPTFSDRVSWDQTPRETLDAWDSSLRGVITFAH